MKLSLSATVLILALAAGLGWHDHQRLANARERHAKLVAEAAPLGISLDPAHPNERVCVVRPHESRAGRPKLTAAEFIGFIKEMKEAEKKQGGRPDEATMHRVMEFMDRLAALGATELKAILAAIRAAPDLDDESRQGLITLTIMTLMNNHPQTALSVFMESSDAIKGDRMRAYFLSSALTRLAKDDPMAAVEWIRNHGGKHPDLVDDDTKRSLLSGVAIQDPKLAFRLIGKLDFKEQPHTVVSDIVGAAKTPEERTTTLTALREHLATLEDQRATNDARQSAMSTLAQAAAQEGFESATSWVAASRMSPEELSGFASGLTYTVKPAETGRWIEWMGETLPSDKGAESIGRMMSRWTENDYQAAGTWLTQTTDGPAKQAAVASYAETVAPYEPATAAQWAMTLPAGKKRDGTLRSIYRKWPKDEPAAKAAAEAFADQHGIPR